MTEMHASYGAPHTGKLGFPDPDAVMFRILSEYPEYKKLRSRAYQALIAEAKDDPDLLEAMLLSEATRSFFRVSSKMTDDDPAKPAETATQRSARVAAEKEAAKKAARKEAEQRAKAAIEKFKHDLIVQAVRKLTFGELAAIANNPHVAKLATMGKEDEIIGEKFDDATIAEVLNGK